MKTLKQISDELGVGKQKVYRFVVKNHITASSEVKQSKLYDEAAERLIKGHFHHITTSNERSGEAHQNRISEAVSDTVNEAIIDLLREELKTLREQLSIKDKQIEQLQAQVSSLTEALTAAHQAAAAAQALHAGTIQQQLQSGENGEVSPRKKGVFGKWFKG